MKIHPREINTFGALVPKLRIQLCFILTLPAIQSCVTKNEIKGIAQVVDVKQGCAIAAQLEYSAFLSSPLCCWSCLHILHPLKPQKSLLLLLFPIPTATSTFCWVTRKKTEIKTGFQNKVYFLFID